MDERRTGEDGYRRRLVEVRGQNPHRPGRPIQPFGYTESERKTLVNGGARASRGYRAPLGEVLRRYTNTGSTARPGESTPRWVRLRNQAERLDDAALGELVDALKAEQRRRRKRE
ncbi:MAG: hypothetical protein L0K86_24680 [Actinomycetia bacterium]|nr:hypothetical protein [Actinomycetes bacterium]